MRLIGVWRSLWFSAGAGAGAGPSADLVPLGEDVPEGERARGADAPARAVPRDLAAARLRRRAQAWGGAAYVRASEVVRPMFYGIIPVSRHKTTLGTTLNSR